MTSGEKQQFFSQSYMVEFDLPRNMAFVAINSHNHSFM